MTCPTPSVTIITPSLNQVEHLARLLDSMSGIAHPGVRHIVIDGGSTDGTVELLRNRTGITWVSEPDAGQADAINKGFAMADSDIVGWVNCDDRYTPGALGLALRAFGADADLNFLFGDALAVDGRGRAYGLRAHVRPCGLEDLVHDGDPIVQPAAFWRVDLMDRVGVLDAGLTYAFDYEYWMRIASVTELAYLPVCLAIESLHGEAKTSRGGERRMAEIEEVARRHGGSGLPRGFRAEAGALASVAALRAGLHGRVDEAWERLVRTRELQPRWTRFAAHLVAEAMPGAGAVPRLRLLANRSRSRRAPVWPTDAEATRLVEAMGQARQQDANESAA